MKNNANSHRDTENFQTWNDVVPFENPDVRGSCENRLHCVHWGSSRVLYKLQWLMEGTFLYCHYYSRL